MKGQAEPQDLPVAGEEALEHGRGQTGRARLARLLDRPIGLEQEIAHGRGPGLLVDLDQRLQFAQMMGVASRMADLGEPGVRLEAVVNRDAADEAVGHLAAFGRHAIIVRVSVATVCSHCPFPATRKPVSSRQRTGAAAARAAMCAATGADAAALPRTRLATLSEHRRNAPKDHASLRRPDPQGSADGR